MSKGGHSGGGSAHAANIVSSHAAKVSAARQSIPFDNAFKRSLVGQVVASPSGIVPFHHGTPPSTHPAYGIYAPRGK